MQMPFFPSGTKLINSTLGFRLQDDFVYYLHNGSPIFCHGKNEIPTYRYVCGSLVVNNLCTISELASALGVGTKNIARYAKKFREQGTSSFFTKPDRRGQCHKITEELMQRAQEVLNSGHSYQKTGQAIGVTEGAIRYHVGRGNLEKPVSVCSKEQGQGSTPQQRNTWDTEAASVLGVAATWVEERIAASRQGLESTPIKFETHQSVEKAGVLLLLPFLLSQGLLTYKRFYRELEKGYYDLRFIILLLALMYLCRIKNPEQLKQHHSGDMGKLMGLDRVPEAKNLRKKVKQIKQQGQAQEWNQYLAGEWMDEQDNHIYYVDGHVQQYFGYKATLGKKYISRQKLCSPGVTEYWVNSSSGMPYLVITGQVNEKLQQMLSEQIVPQIKKLVEAKQTDRDKAKDADTPLFTIVFDREAYSPIFFKQLWQEHQVAVITYKKNVKDKWATTDFASHPIQVHGEEVEMNLAEKTVTLAGMSMREVRKFNPDTQHQTAIITTYKKLDLKQVAVYMFSRWTQENFFRYLRLDYALDKLTEYAINQLDDELEVRNPKYSKLTDELKKIREKITRRQAQLFLLTEQSAKAAVDGQEPLAKKQAQITEQVEELQKQVQRLLDERKQQPVKIKIGQMPEHSRYNKLDSEAKLFQNIIKMICYRAETAFTQLLSSAFRKKDNEMRMFAKQVIQTKGDITPDYQNQTLTVELYSLATPRDNKEIAKICDLLNDTQTLYPGTKLRLVYKIRDN